MAKIRFKSGKYFGTSRIISAKFIFFVYLMAIIELHCKDCESMGCSLLSECPSDWIDFISESKYCIEYDKNQHIYFEGAKSDTIFFVQSGIVKIFKHSNQRPQQILGFYGKGSILGHRGLGESFIYPHGASTVVPSRICHISFDRFYEILGKVPELTFNLVLLFASELRYLETRIKDFSTMTMREKVYQALLEYHAAYLSSNFEDPFFECPRQLLADFAGTTVEQVSRFVSELKVAGFIALEGRKVRMLEPKQIRDQIRTS